MKLFLSWSGERSHRVAELIGDWISGVIQQIEPWISSEMDRGSVWFPEIGKALDSVNNGIVCLTRENLNAPWILFEAGALARNFGSNRVCTFLIDVKPSDVSDPLAQFNHTAPTKDSMFQLAKTLNERLNEGKLSDVKLQKEFDLHWDLFESEFEKIIDETQEGKKPPRKSDREILNDIVDMLQIVSRRLNLLTDSPFVYTGKDYFRTTIRKIPQDARSEALRRLMRLEEMEYMRGQLSQEEQKICCDNIHFHSPDKKQDTTRKPEDDDKA